MGENEKARETYDQCLKEKDLTAEAYNGLAYCAASEEDYEAALSYIQEDELLEVTPKTLRLRKRILDPIARKRAKPEVMA